MDETSSSTDPQSIIDRVIGALREGRNKSMQQRKASIQKEFMIARRWIEDAYSEYGPEDLPVDVHRIQRDLAVTRDSLIDRDCEGIDKEYRVAVSILKTVATENPGYYSVAERTTKQSKGWRRPLPTVVAPKMARALPSKVIESLSASVIQQIVSKILNSSKIGVGFNEIAKSMGLDAADKLQTRAAAKQFVTYLRGKGHVTVVGTGRGQKMRATKSLVALRDALVTELEA